MAQFFIFLFSFDFASVGLFSMLRVLLRALLLGLPLLSGMNIHYPLLLHLLLLLLQPMLLQTLQRALIFGNLALPFRYLFSSYFACLLSWRHATTMNTVTILAFLRVTYLWLIFLCSFPYFSSSRCRWLHFIYLFIRCNYFTYIFFECNGNWRLISVPFISHDNTNLVGYGVQIGPNDFLLLSPTPLDLLRARLQRKQRDSRHGRHGATSSAEPSSRKNSSRPDTDAQSASKSSTNKATASNEASPADSAFTTSNETPADNLSQELPDRAKAEKNARRNAKKKAKKREKKLKLALLGTSGSHGQGEVLSEECTPETCAHDDINLGDETDSQEATSVDQLSHSHININDLIGHSNSSITNSSEPKEPMMSTPEDGSTQTKDQQFFISVRWQERHDDGQLCCCDDTSTNNTSDLPDSIIRDSLCVGHEAITKAGYDVNLPNLEICSTETKECFSDQSSLDVTAVTRVQTQECSTREVKLVVSGKKNKRAKKLQQNGQERKENGPSARQKVLRDKVSKSEQSDDDTFSGCAKKYPRSSPVKKSTATLKNDPGLKILNRPDIPVLGNGDEPASRQKSSSDSDKCGTHGLETELSKILVTLNDSYRARQLCEALQVGTGNPIAEFEKLISAATPAICLWDKEFGRPLCGNEIPNISLEHLWTWYIEPGSYGVVVSTEDFGYSNSTGFRLSDFHAHFVPSLSAVQLFHKSRAFGTGT